MNAWLKPLRNTLTVSLAQPSPAPVVILPPVPLPAPDVHAELYTLKPNSRTNERDQLLAKFARVANDLLPFSGGIPFNVTDPPPTRLWAEAVPLDGLSSADKNQLQALVLKHTQAIAARDLDAVSALLAYKTRDCALADGQDPDEMMQVIRKQYANVIFSEPSLTIDTQINLLEFKLVAGGQVVWIFQSLEKPALVLKSPTKRFTISLFAARIGDTWRIVR